VENEDKLTKISKDLCKQAKFLAQHPDSREGVWTGNYDINGDKVTARFHGGRVIEAHIVTEGQQSKL